MFKKMEIVKVSNNIYNIYNKEDDKRKKYIIKTPELYTPFGLEKYNDKYILNMEIEKGSEFSRLLVNIDNFFMNIESVNSDNIGERDYYMSLKSREKYNSSLLRTQLKQSKNIITTDIKDIDNNILSINDIKSGDKLILYIEISRLWLNDKSYGLNYDIKQIIKVNKKV